MLSNPMAVGEIRHRDKVYDGLYDALIDDETWEKVQAMLAANGRSHRNRRNAYNPSPLTQIPATTSGLFSNRHLSCIVRVKI